MKITIQYQDQFGHWKHYQTQHHQPSAFKTAESRAQSTGKRHRLVSDEGVMLDLISP